MRTNANGTVDAVPLQADGSIDTVALGKAIFGRSPTAHPSVARATAEALDSIEGPTQKARASLHTAADVVIQTLASCECEFVAEARELAADVHIYREAWIAALGELARQTRSRARLTETVRNQRHELQRYTASQIGRDT